MCHYKQYGLIGYNPAQSHSCELCQSDKNITIQTFMWTIFLSFLPICSCQSSFKVAAENQARLWSFNRLMHTNKTQITYVTLMQIT